MTIGSQSAFLLSMSIFKMNQQSEVWNSHLGRKFSVNFQFVVQYLAKAETYSCMHSHNNYIKKHIIIHSVYFIQLLVNNIATYRHVCIVLPSCCSIGPTVCFSHSIPRVSSICCLPSAQFCVNAALIREFAIS